MTQYLPPNLLALFAPRDPIPYMPPTCKLPWEKKNSIYHGVGQFVSNFEDPKDTPPPTRVENRDERKERKKKERAEQVAYKLEQDLAMWDPSNDPNIQGDPYKTLFVARINYDSSESKLRREFEMYGPVKRIKLVHDIKSGKPRGYAYIEYEHERDMHSAYKHADGRKIDGRRVLVDVERGRTVKGWRPRRLGGGLGSTRKGGPDVNSKYSGRDEPGKERDRSRSRSRERPERPRRRSRTPERTERRRRSRSREPREVREPREAREPREPRRRRSKSRERKRSPKTEKDEERPNRRRRSRSRHRSRSRDRKRRRSRSRDRKRSKDRVREPKQEPEDGGYVDNGAGDNNEERSEENEEVVIKKEKEDRGYDKHQLPPEIEEGEQVEEMGGYGDGGGEAEEGYNENGDFGEEQGDEGRDNNDDDDDPRQSKMMESRNYEQQDGGDDNDEGNNDGEEIEEGEAD